MNEAGVLKLVCQQEVKRVGGGSRCRHCVSAFPSLVVREVAEWGDLTCWDSVFGEPRSDVTWKHLFQVEGDVRGASLAFMCGEDWVE